MKPAATKAPSRPSPTRLLHRKLLVPVREGGFGFKGPAMASELDHLFVCTSVGAPEADSLLAFGLTEGASNTHPGQGTANRRFFFHNAMLELLWVQDPAEAQSELVRPLRLWERWSRRDSGACPFGFCFRPAASAAEGPPFPFWEYHPAYLPAPLSIHVATSSEELGEPLLFYLGFASRPDGGPPATRQPLDHPAGLREITRVRWVRPHTGPMSPELEPLVRAGHVSVGPGAEHLLEIGFDGERQGRSADFRPAMPLMFHW